MSNYKGGVRNRRSRALLRLKEQLKTGMKPALRPARGVDVPLDDKDVKRIEKEIEVLTKRT